jgi:putative phage-type endonuclease
MFIYIDVEQGSSDWHQHRCGSLGASQVHEVLAKTKSGYSAARGNAIARIVSEKLTGVVQETYKNAAMQWGNDTEPQARSAYSFFTGNPVSVVGMFKHPTMAGTHASPDGLVNDDGLIEIKCPNTLTHIETLDSEKIDPKYITQMQWQMFLTGRDWCDFVSFDPRMPDDLQLFIKRVRRDPQHISELCDEVSKFLGEVDEMMVRIDKIRAKRA